MATLTPTPTLTPTLTLTRYELDGRTFDAQGVAFPVCHGPTSSETFLKDAAKVRSSNPNPELNPNPNPNPDPDPDPDPNPNPNPN